MPPSKSVSEIVPDVLPNTPFPIEEKSQPVDPNGHGNGRLEGSLDQHALLNALQAMRLGDFSVRLPRDLDRIDREDRRHLQRDRRGQ